MHVFSAKGLLRAAVLGIAVQAPAQLTPEFRAEVDLVRVPCVVTDVNGAYVRGLRREDFVVLEDRHPREVKYFWRESDLPLTIGLIADVSGSQRVFLEKHRQTVLDFLSRVLTPNDRAFLVSVALQQRLVADLTGSVERLRAGVQAFGSEEPEILGDPCCAWGIERHFPIAIPGHPVIVRSPGTALWNGVYFAAKLKLKQFAGRRALLLLTDGWDTGSDHGIGDAIEACQSADAVVYSIRHVDPAQLHSNAIQPLPVSMERRIRRHMERIFAKAQRDLKRISHDTGGQVFEGESADISAVFGIIETALRSEYVLGFEQSTSLKGYHKIQVKVRRPGVVVRARDGYYVQ